MPSTFSTRLGVELQANGENLNTWGTKANTGYKLLEEAVSGYVAITISGDTTLTITDGTESSGATDQARNALLKLTGSPAGAFNLTLPEVEKAWVVWNDTGQTATLRTTTATATVSLPDERIVIVHSDGAGSVFQVTPIITDAGAIAGAASFTSVTATTADINGGTIDGVTLGGSSAVTGTFSTIDINGGSVDGATIGASSAASGAFTTLTASTSATLAGLAYPTTDGSAGQYITTDGAGNLTFGTPAGAGDLLASANLSDLDNAATARVNLGAANRAWVTKTTTYTAVAGDRLIADTSGAAFTITLPASPSSGDEVWFADPGANWATNNLTVSGNGNNIDGASTFAADVSEGGFIAVYNGTAWVVRFATGVA